MIRFGRRSKTEKELSCAAIIVAAGSASRMQGIDKMMADLAGEPVLLHTLRTFNGYSRIDEIVVVTREDLMMEVEELCRTHSLDKVHYVILGGEERTDSVMAGLDCIADRNGLVAIQDGARPLVTQQLILETIEKAAATSGQYSFEERMGCGFGACMGCSCKTKYGNKRICKDGPVLEREEIVW